ncbi:MAG: diadenosine tetraphosphatase [Phycisphaera sp. RhM]|nr:diadenosine tetraphosphatase [Phycisphaera sp. RhM]
MNKATLYDIIGDIHGHAEELKRLLEHLGYRRHGAGYRRSDRMLVFAGDFDRGPAIAEVIEIVRATVDTGDGFAVMGNHEYNAITFQAAVPGEKDSWFREHSEKNRAQHQATLEQLSPNEMADAIAWFKTLPVAKELDGIRVVHAAWRDEKIRLPNETLKSPWRFDADFFAETESAGSKLHSAVEEVLKGPELTLPAGHWIVDKAGHKRNTVRFKWYEEPAGRTYRG